MPEPFGLAPDGGEVRVICAPDKFKGTLRAVDVATAIADGIHAVAPAVRVERIPIADGGDGTVDAAVSTGMAAVTVDVCGPTGEPVRATIAVRHPLAVVELANCCGLSLLPAGVLQPLDSHTVGLGQAIAAALDRGCSDIVLGVGGSASNDLGLGMLVGLGARLLDAYGGELPPTPRGHRRLAAIDLRGLHPGLAGARIRVATDVENPLLGEHGAVAVFGAQKGVTPDLGATVEAGLAHVARVLESTTGREIIGRPGMGAAGGVPGALTAVCNAEVVSGAEFVLDMVDLETRVAGADLVVTGEGSFDAQTLHGKGPAAVLAVAQRLGVPSAVVAGRVAVPDAVLASLGVARHWSLLDRVAEAELAFREPALLLREIGGEMARWLAKP